MDGSDGQVPTLLPAPEAEPQPPLKRTVTDAAVATASIEGWSVNHFGTRGILASAGTKRGDYVPTWRDRYFLLAEDGNFLVYYLSADEPIPRGVFSLVGATIESTLEQGGCGIEIDPVTYPGTIHIAMPTPATRDAWVEALREASKRTFVDSVANRALLPRLDTLSSRVHTVLFGKEGSTFAEHNYERVWCVLSDVAPCVWTFKNDLCKHQVGLVALEDCVVELCDEDGETGTGFGQTDEVSLGGLSALGEIGPGAICVKHHLRIRHIFDFSTSSERQEWLRRLHDAAKETTWRGEERAVFNAEARPKDRLTLITPQELEPCPATPHTEHDQAFRQKFDAAHAPPQRGWTAADMVASAAAAVQGGIETATELLQLDSELYGPAIPAERSIMREAMSKMTAGEIATM